ncbi:hypothetical protein G3M55_54050, partial [Streptomyces sp. SID8455]|nr:hypothetical protein [Streptomyces sp. SID8455]
VRDGVLPDPGALDGVAALVLRTPAPGGADDDPVRAAHRTAAHVLDVVQRFLADERYADVRLAVVTRSAVAVRDGEEITGLAGAPVWGLVRAVQAEHPGRLVLVDGDGSDDLSPLTAEEPQLALREGR